MADCELLAGCVFFNDKLDNMPGLAEIYKDRYCRKDNSQCARYVVAQALGREKVPLNLYPNQMPRAKEIIAKG